MNRPNSVRYSQVQKVFMDPRKQQKQLKHWVVKKKKFANPKLDSKYEWMYDDTAAQAAKNIQTKAIIFKMNDAVSTNHKGTVQTAQ
ncbi:8832_t:CDS:2 [Racocetra persica]|uniref:8832_t:CDS:1 n=1 Tax=Racocetra persica TaxID=160502 RepID=A0ACA9MGZ3_9GLOM|nr:8832_t:CDS:2 [Racocetra persica]